MANGNQKMIIDKMTFSKYSSAVTNPAVNYATQMTYIMTFEADIMPLTIGVDQFKQTTISMLNPFPKLLVVKFSALKFQKFQKRKLSSDSTSAYHIIVYQITPY